MIPAKGRNKFIDYSKSYITNIISPIYSNKKFSDIVFNTLFADYLRKSEGGI